MRLSRLHSCRIFGNLLRIRTWIFRVLRTCCHRHMLVLMRNLQASRIESRRCPCRRTRTRRQQQRTATLSWPIIISFGFELVQPLVPVPPSPSRPVQGKAVPSTARSTQPAPPGADRWPWSASLSGKSAAAGWRCITWRPAPAPRCCSMARPSPGAGPCPRGPRRRRRHPRSRRARAHGSSPRARALCLRGFLPGKIPVGPPIEVARNPFVRRSDPDIGKTRSIFTLLLAKWKPNCQVEGL